MSVHLAFLDLPVTVARDFADLLPLITQSLLMAFFSLMRFPRAEATKFDDDGNGHVERFGVCVRATMVHTPYYVDVCVVPWSGRIVARGPWLRCGGPIVSIQFVQPRRPKAQDGIGISINISIRTEDGDVLALNKPQHQRGMAGMELIRHIRRSKQLG